MFRRHAAAHPTLARTIALLGGLALVLALVPGLSSPADAATNSDLSVSKVADPDPVEVGGTIEYTITVVNAGPDTVSGVEALDRLPEEVRFGAASDSAGSSCGFDGTFARCDIGMMAPGTITMTVLGEVISFPEGGKLVNFASVFPEDDPSPGNNHTNIETTVTTDEGTPALGIEKFQRDEEGEDPTQRGEFVGYKLRVFNDGTAPAVNVVAIDFVPNGMVPDFPLPAGCEEKSFFGAPIIYCTVGTLEPGSEVLIDLVFEVLENAKGGSVIVNTATADADNTEPVSDAEATSILGTPKLTIDKSDSRDPVEVGENNVYAIVVTNEGDDVAENVKVKDTLPKEVKFRKAITERGKCRRVHRTVNCSIGDLAPGESVTVTIKVKTKDDAVEPGSKTNGVKNVAKATAANAGTVRTSERTTVFNPKKGPILFVEKSDIDNVVEPGDDVTYEIKITNIGDETAEGIDVTDDLPDGLTFVSGTHECDLPGIDPTLVLCEDVADLEPGASVTVTVVAAVDESFTETTVVTNVASATPASGKGDDDAEKTQVFVGTPVLEVDKSDTFDPVGIGEETSYVVTVRNTGDATARGLTVTDQFPEDIDFVPGTSDPECTLTTSAGGRDLVDCDLPDLAPGASITVTLGARAANNAPAFATVENLAGAEADNAALVQDSEATTIEVALPELNVLKTALTDAVQIGDTITYRIEVFNDGTGTAENVSIVDLVPDTTTAGSPGDDCEVKNGVDGPFFECLLGDLAPHDSRVVSFEVVTTAQGDVENVATVTADDHEDVEDTVTTTVGFCPGFAGDPRNQVIGTEGPDVLTGTGEDDIICGFDGDDEIEGGGGNDLILAGPGHDTAAGGGGNDQIDGDVGNDFIDGGGGHDILVGGPEVDTSLGGDVDTVNGGDGNDAIEGGADGDSLFGSRGDDVISGGDGDDTISGSQGSDAISGGDGDDDITGGDKKDIIEGGRGSDLADGGGGPDVIRGGDDGDILKGGPSDDKLFGEAGNDFLEGEDGRDRLAGGADKDSLDGGPDRDTCIDQKKGTDFKSCEKT